LVEPSPPGRRVLVLGFVKAQGVLVLVSDV
ncbi:MAG: hypothetical protein ACI8Z0_001094, partial [Lentimonas sp.]